MLTEDSGTVSLEAEATRLEFDLGSGAFSIYSGDVRVFAGATGRVQLRRSAGKGRKGEKVEYEYLETPGSWEVLEAGDGLLLAGRGGWGRLVYRVRSDGPAILLELGLDWDGEGDPPEVEAIEPLLVPAGGIWPGREVNRSWRFYSNGWQCWSPSGVLKRRRPGDFLFPLFMPRFLKPMLANTATPVSSVKGDFTAEWFGALADLEVEDSLVVGFTGVCRALSQVSVSIGGGAGESELETAARFEGKKVERGSVFWSEPLAVIPGDLTGRNLEHYAELVAAAQGSRVRRSPVGWCSWYQYFNKVTAGDVAGNLGLASDEYNRLGIELVQVDDGYQANIGDWLETNRRFPEGMEEVAGRIAAAGKMPGVWVAPFTVTRRSRVFREKKEWVLRNRRGRPVLAGVNPLWRGRFYGLDITNPEVLDWLGEVFKTLSRQGFRFIKLDFMACGLLEGGRHDPSVTRAEAARRALRVIRDSIGDDAFILAAGGPILLGTGILDIQRVGGDVAPYWRPLSQVLLRDRSMPGVRNSLINVFTRCFLSGRLWEGDPDCMMARGAETRLKPAERRTLASGVAVLGGAFILSDNLELWGPEEELMAGCMLPAMNSRPFCPDLWLREIPRYLVTRLEDPGGDYFLAWVVNWSNSRDTLDVSLSELGIDAGRYHAHEFWTCRYLGEVEDSIRLRDIPGHGSAVLRLTPVGDSARLLGSNIHISQGSIELDRLEEAEDGVSLSFTGAVRCNAVVTVGCPHSLEAGGGGGVRLKRVGKSVYRLEFELDGSRDIFLAREERPRGGGSDDGGS